MNQAGIPPTCLQNRAHCLAYWCGGKKKKAQPASDVFAFVSTVFSGCSQRPAFSRSKGARINISIFLPTPTVSHLIQLVFLLWRAAICKKKWKSTTCQFIQANDVYTDIPHWWNRPNIPFPVQRREGGKNERQKGVTQAPPLPPAFFLLSNLYLTLPSLALLRLHPAQPEPEHWYQAADVLPHPKHTHSLKIHTHCILGGGGGEGGRDWPIFWLATSGHSHLLFGPECRRCILVPLVLGAKWYKCQEKVVHLKVEIVQMPGNGGSV